jgi:hypothetical protein
MAWQEIGAGEVDAKSPVDVTLLSKIRNNLAWLLDSGKYCLFNNTAAGEPAGGNVPYEIKVRLPPLTKTLKMRIRARASAAGAWHAHVNGADTDSYAPSGSGYEEFTLTKTDPGGDIVTISVQNEWPESSYVHWMLVWVDAGK